MSTDAIDDPVEELLRQDLAEARRQEGDGHRHQVDPYRAAQLKQEAWEAWQRLETHLRAKGRPETLAREFGEGEPERPGTPLSGVAPVVRGLQDEPPIREE